MNANHYYQSLIQQGYNSAAATNFTQYYYPNFDGPSQEMAMMNPPPPGSIEMGGMVTGGIGTSAAGVAAAGGGMSMATIAVVCVLVLGGVGTGGYFLYDYLTEPEPLDFYGEVYWAKWGVAHIFQEDGMQKGAPLLNGSCDDYQNDEMDVPINMENGICVEDQIYDKYSSENKGDYYRICSQGTGEGSIEEEDPKYECYSAYPLEQGLVLRMGGYCFVFVSDIDMPPGTVHDSNVLRNGMTFWVDAWEDIEEEIKNDDDAPKCNYFL